MAQGWVVGERRPQHGTAVSTSGTMWAAEHVPGVAVGLGSSVESSVECWGDAQR